MKGPSGLREYFSYNWFAALCSPWRSGKAEEAPAGSARAALGDPPPLLPAAARGAANVPVTPQGWEPLSLAHAHAGTAHAGESHNCRDPALIRAVPTYEWGAFQFTKSDTVQPSSWMRVPVSDFWMRQLAAVGSWWVMPRNIMCSNKPR